MAHSKTLGILIAALVLVLGFDAVVKASTDSSDVSLTDRLAVPPVEGGVYLLGNSMFKTGVDVEAMQAGIPERDVRFNYYDGHYTSLWYLIAEGALGPSEQRPEIIVWGFRPRYAALPAFRQNRPNSTELFVFDDLAYERLTGEAAVTPVIDAQSFLDGWSGVYGHRSETQNAVSRTTEQLGLNALDAAGRDTAGLRERLIDGDSSIADEIVSAATGGEVQLTEEQVVDGVGDFITGAILPFDDGFIPLTAESFAESGYAQLVVIWRPVNAAEGNPDPAEDQFVADAIEYFEANGIPYVDFYHDERIGASMYGKGDHYNAEGRALITDTLTTRVLRLTDR
jgi:hypothetical protein